MGERYSVGKDGLDCMTLVREVAKENPDNQILQDYLAFMQNNRGNNLNFENFFASQDPASILEQNSDWQTVKADLPSGEYLVNFASPGHPDGIYGPESHGGILQVVEDASGNKDFTLSHASTASLGVEGLQEPVPLNTLRIQVDDKDFTGRDIVEGFRKDYSEHITDQTDGSRVYSKELVGKLKFFDQAGKEIKPQLEPDGSIRLGHVIQEKDLDSYFAYNSDFSKDISVMDLKFEKPLV